MFCIEQQENLFFWLLNEFFPFYLKEFSSPLLFFIKTDKGCITDLSYGLMSFFFSNNGVYISLNKRVFSSAASSLNFMSMTNKFPILSSIERSSSIKLNSLIVRTFFFFFDTAGREWFCHGVSVLVIFVHF